MTVLALRYPATGRFPRSSQPAGPRFGRGVCGDAKAKPMADSPKLTLTEIRDRIQRETYQVDADQVADAIVERLLAGSVRPKAGTCNHS